MQLRIVTINVQTDEGDPRRLELVNRELHRLDPELAALVPLSGEGEVLFIAATAVWRLDAEAARERQALAITDLDARHRTSLPTIIAGDLNAAPTRPASTSAPPHSPSTNRLTASGPATTSASSSTLRSARTTEPRARAAADACQLPAWTA